MSTLDFSIFFLDFATGFILQWDSPSLSLQICKTKQLTTRLHRRPCSDLQNIRSIPRASYKLSAWLCRSWMEHMTSFFDTRFAGDTERDGPCCVLVFRLALEGCPPGYWCIVFKRPLHLSLDNVQAVALMWLATLCDRLNSRIEGITNLQESRDDRLLKGLCHLGSTTSRAPRTGSTAGLRCASSAFEATKPLIAPLDFIARERPVYREQLGLS